MAILSSFSRFLQIAVQAVEAAEQQVIVNAVGLDLHDLLVLLDGQLEHIVGAVAARHVAQRTEIDAAEQLVRFQVLGIALDDVLRFEHGVADASGFYVEFGQAGGQEFRRRIGFDREAVFLDGFVGQVAAAVHRDLLFVHVRDGVVVVGGGAVGLARRGFGIGRLGIGLSRRRLVCPTAATAATEIIRKRRKNLFMLDLTALKRILETSATWMQSRRGKGALYSTPSTRGWKKTRLLGRNATEPEGQGLVGNC